MLLEPNGSSTSIHMPDGPLWDPADALEGSAHTEAAKEDTVQVFQVGLLLDSGPGQDLLDLAGPHEAIAFLVVEEGPRAEMVPKTPQRHTVRQEAGEAPPEPAHAERPPFLEYRGNQRRILRAVGVEGSTPLQGRSEVGSIVDPSSKGHEVPVRSEEVGADPLWIPGDAQNHGPHGLHDPLAPPVGCRRQHSLHLGRIRSTVSGVCGGDSAHRKPDIQVGRRRRPAERIKARQKDSTRTRRHPGFACCLSLRGSPDPPRAGDRCHD